MRNHCSINNRQRVRGAAMVELAIIAPMLLALFFGLAEVGRALLLHHALVDQVESGTRYLGRSYQTLNSDCSTAAGWTAATSTAANLVVYGNEAGSGYPIISGMKTSNVTTSVAAKTVTGTVTPTVCVVSLSARVTYPGIFGNTVPLFGIAMPTLKADSQERYAGQ